MSASALRERTTGPSVLALAAAMGLACGGQGTSGPPGVVLVVLAALLIVWDFAVFPALRGSQLKPVEGLRDG